MIFPSHGSNQALVATDRDAGRPGGDGDGDVVVPRPLRQPAHGRRADGAQRLPRPCPSDDGRLTFYASTQMPHGLHDQLAGALGDGPRRRCASSRPQVGGGFGGKAGICAEYSAVAGAARQLGRPVTWTPTRSEDLVALPHSRGQVQYAELGCRRRRHVHRPAGAARRRRRRLPGHRRVPARPAPSGCPTARTASRRSSSTSPSPSPTRRRWAPTAAPAARRRRRCSSASSTTPPSSSSIDPIELRRRNLLADDAFPFTTLTGVTYDTGDYSTAARRRRRGDRLRRAARRAGARAVTAGDRIALGIGVAAYVEITAGGGAGEFGARRGPRRRLGDRARRHVLPRPGPPDGVRHARQRPDRHPGRADPPRRRRHRPRAHAAAAPAARARCSSAGRPCTRRPRRWSSKAKRLAAHLLEADVGRHRRRHRPPATVGVAGVPASALTWAELATPGRRGAARAARRRRRHGVLGRRGRLRPGRRRRSRSAPTSPSSRSTSTPGSVRVLRHVAVDDCGTVLNPLLVEGQQHGGVAAGHRPGAVRGGPLRRRRQPADGDPRRLRHPLRRRAAELRGPLDRDADAAQPARRQGHRRGRHDRLDAGGAERRDRRARPPRRAPPRHAVHARAGVARRSATPRPARCPTRGASRRRSSHPARRPG